MMATPHVLVEGAIIAAYAIRARHAFIYVRGEVVPVLRRLQTAVAEAYDAGLPRHRHPRLGVRPGPGGARRRRRLHLRRGDRTAGLAGGQARSAPAAAAVPRGRRSLRVPDGGQQRRVHRQRARRRARRHRLVQVDGVGEVPRLHAVLVVGTRHHARPVRGAAGHHPSRTARLRGRGAGRPRAEVLDARRIVDPAADGRTPRRPTGLREHGEGRFDAGHQGAADLRRDHVRGAGGPSVDAVLRPRVLRQVHAVPRGHLLVGADLRASRERHRPTRRTSTSCSTSPTPSSASRSARSATVRPARSCPPSSTSATSTSRTSTAGARSTRTPRCSPRRREWAYDDRGEQGGPDDGCTGGRDGDTHHRRPSRSVFPRARW